MQEVQVVEVQEVQVVEVQVVQVQHLSEGGVGEDVREDLHGAVQVAGEALGIEHGLLPAGVGVQVRAHVLHLVHGEMVKW